jgi:hypothetical protein
MNPQNNPKDTPKEVLDETSKGPCLIPKIYFKDIAEWDWGTIAQAFDDMKTNIDYLYYFLLNVMTEKKVCKEKDCPVFKKIKELNDFRDSFDCKTKTEAVTAIKDKMKLNDFTREFDTYITDAKEVFNLMLTTASTRETKIYEEEIYHNRNIEMIQTIGKYQVKTDTELGHYIGDVINHNSRMGELGDMLKSHNEKLDQNLKEKEKEKENSTAKKETKKEN